MKYSAQQSTQSVSNLNKTSSLDLKKKGALVRWGEILKLDYMVTGGIQFIYRSPCARA